MVCNGLGSTVLMLYGVGAVGFLVTWFLLMKLGIYCCNLHSQVETLKEKVKRLEKLQE